MQMINRQMDPNGALDLSDDEKISAILNDGSKMDSLLEYLKLVNELDDESVQPIRAHYGLADEIARVEELKKQAAIEEDYENAANYKKQIVKLKSEAMTTERLKTEYLEQKPILRVKDMFVKLCDIDPGYTRTLLLRQDKQVPQKK